MEKSINAKQLFDFRDQLCSLKLVIAMVLDNRLQSATSSIYPSLTSADDAQNQKLLNLYYIPNSEVAVAENTTINDLITNVYGELDKLSSVFLSDAAAQNLVNQTASKNAQSELTLTLGNASVRTAFTVNHGVNYVPETALFDFFGDSSFVLNDNEQKSLALLVFEVANQKAAYNSVQAEISSNNLEGLSNALNNALTNARSNAQLPLDSELEKTVSSKLASIILENNTQKLVTFIGTNIYKPSW